jgi:hypothetical protein
MLKPNFAAPVATGAAAGLLAAVLGDITTAAAVGVVGAVILGSGRD